MLKFQTYNICDEILRIVLQYNLLDGAFASSISMFQMEFCKYYNIFNGFIK